MQKDTVVFLNMYPLGKIFAKAIDMDRYAESGNSIKYLDMSKIYFPDTCEKYGAGSKEYVVKKDYFIECKNKEEVKAWIKKYSNRAWFFVLHKGLFINPYEGTWLYRTFKKYKCDYIIQNLAPFPNHSIGSSGGKRKFIYYNVSTLIKMVIDSRYKDILKAIVRRVEFILMRRNILFKAPTYSFMAGNVDITQSKKLYAASKTVSIPSLDYSNFRHMRAELNKTKKNHTAQNYLLYVDTGWIGSPDAALFGLQTIDEGLFVRKINRFFDKLENVAGKRVVVATSGKYLYKGDEFNGRDIIYHRTCELTYYADMVFGHSSTALGYAAVMHKPLVFLTIDELSDSTKKEIERFAQVFEKKVMNIDEGFNIAKLNEFSKVNNYVYERFVQDYMASQPFTLSCSEVIISTLKGI